MWLTSYFFQRIRFDTTAPACVHEAARVLPSSLFAPIAFVVVVVVAGHMWTSASAHFKTSLFVGHR